jgi:hypothetical protein
MGSVSAPDVVRCQEERTITGGRVQDKYVMLADPDLRGATSSGSQRTRQIGARGGNRQLHARVGYVDRRRNRATRILFPNVRIEEGAVVENSLLFQGVTVGEEAQLQRCIVEKHVLMPPGERIGFDRARDAERFTVSEGGVVVIGKG